ncbi:MAG: hypothetical protein MZU95_05035 [Desulfomicrobium escambiense]|nr:hypothetical protein [Desulfomicrobium escambiense]
MNEGNVVEGRLAGFDMDELVPDAGFLQDAEDMDKTLLVLRVTHGRLVPEEYVIVHKADLFHGS